MILFMKAFMNMFFNTFYLTNPLSSFSTTVYSPPLRLRYNKMKIYENNIQLIIFASSEITK